HRIEVLAWVLYGVRPLTLNELKLAVETSLDDEMIDFRQFVETECGAFLSITPHADHSATVHIGHETFREYLKSGESRICPQLSVSHAKMARVCLDLISNASLNGKSMQNYALDNWFLHFSEAISAHGKHQALEL